MNHERTPTRCHNERPNDDAFRRPERAPARRPAAGVPGRLRIGLILLALTAGAGFAQSLTVWTVLDGSALAYLEQDAATFARAADVDIEVERFEVGDLRLRMLSTSQRESAADVIVGVAHEDARAMAVAGVLADLTRAVTDAYLDDLSAPSRRAFTVDGRLFGLPLSVQGPALLYNRDLLAEVPETYPELVAVARELTRGDTFGYLHDIENFYFSYAWLHTWGGYVFGRAGGGPDPRDVGLATPAAVRGGEALRALRFEHGLVPAGTGYEGARDRFLDGALAMFYTGPWELGAARRAGIDVGVAPMPPLADGTSWSGFMGARGVVVDRLAEGSTDAINLAKWLVRADAQRGYARVAARIPTSRTALEADTTDPALAAFGEALRHAEPLPAIPEMRRVWGPMADALGAIAGDPGADVEAALRAAVRRILRP